MQMQYFPILVNLLWLITYNHNSSSFCYNVFPMEPINSFYFSIALKKLLTNISTIKSSLQLK